MLGILGLAASIVLPSVAAHAVVPVAVDDDYSITAGTALEPPAPGVFVNDRGISRATMSIRVVSDPVHGTAMVTGQGLFRYQSEPGFSGADAFTYCVVLSAAPTTCISGEATVSIEVSEAEAFDDTYYADVNTGLNVASPGVLANDLGIVPPMTAKIDPATYGTVVPGSSGGFGYTPPSGFRGTDSFAYCVVENAGTADCISNTATAIIQVGLSGLSAVDDHYGVDLDSALAVPPATGVLANDGGALPSDVIDVVAEPAHGALTAIGPGGGFTYTPDRDFVGSDSFTYCVTVVPSTPPCLSRVALVTIDVHPVAIRVGGPDRFAVSAAVSARTFAPGVPVAYVASGAVFADALSGAAAAGVQHGPVLLTTRDSVPAPILTELRRLQPTKIVILGGASSVGAVVEAALGGLAPTVVRFGGADRYAVSARVSRETFAADAPVAYVASGENFPDALSGSAAAGHLGGPVLLATRDSVPADVVAELGRLSPDRIVVLGGQNSVSAGVLATLGGLAPTTRIGGADRFEVSAAVSRSTFPTGSRTVYVASGVVFPDALSGSAAAVAHNGPVLLVGATAIPTAVALELDRLDPVRIVLLGGSATVSDAVLTSLRGYLVG